MKNYLKYGLIPILLIVNIALLSANLFYKSEFKELKENIAETQLELAEQKEVLKSEQNKLDNTNNKLDIPDTRPTSSEAAQNPNASPAPANSEKPAVSPSPTPESTKSPAIQGNISVCIDAGHGITNRKETEPVSPGSSTKKAANVSGAAGEEEFNLAVALLLRDKLQAAGITVDMVRTTHECDKSNVERAQQANNSDFCIRIHADGSTNSSANGISVLVPEKSYYNDSNFVPDSRALAQSILSATVAKTGAKNIGVITRSDMTGFNWSKVPVVLIECGFMSNPTESAKLKTQEYRQKLADGIAQGFLNYIKSVQN